MKREMTGAEMVVQALVDQGVKHIFGYPGGAVLPIYDEIIQQDRIAHILVRHEQGAGHAAEGYARSTGKSGVALAPRGRAPTNLVTPLTDALMDSIPDRLPHRPGADPSHRQRRLPGMRHGRHHAAGDQAQLAGPRRQRPVARPARGLLRRHPRPPGPGPGRHPQGRPVRPTRHLHGPGPRRAQDLSSAHRRAIPAPIRAAVELIARARPSGRSSTPAAASSIPGRGRRRCCASSCTLTGYPITSTLMGLGA